MAYSSRATFLFLFLIKRNRAFARATFLFLFLIKRNRAFDQILLK